MVRLTRRMRVLLACYAVKEVGCLRWFVSLHREQRADVDDDDEDDGDDAYCCYYHLFIDGDYDHRIGI